MGYLNIYVAQLGRELSKYYDVSEKDMKIVLEHSYAGAATSLCPVPFATFGLNLANQAFLYKRINDYLGIRTMSPKFLKVIAGIVASQVLGALAVFPVAIGGVVCGEFLKLIPGAGTVAGMFVEAGSFGAITFVMGVVYLSAIKKMIGTNKELTEENIKEALNKELGNKEAIRQVFKEAKKVHHDSKK